MEMTHNNGLSGNGKRQVWQDDWKQKSKRNDALRCRCRQNTCQWHGHPERHGKFQNCECYWLGHRTKEGKGSGENKAEESYIHILLQGTCEGVFISQEINRTTSRCLQIYLSNFCGFKWQVI